MFFACACQILKSGLYRKDQLSLLDGQSLGNAGKAGAFAM
jgi:hypothetical protein